MFQNITINQIVACINLALDALYIKASYLIFHDVEEAKCLKNQYKYVSERSIVFRFGIYFNDIFNKLVSQEYHIDAEYNRSGNNSKSMRDLNDPSKNINCVPDLIVHRRGNQNNNLVIIEFKTWWNCCQDNDFCKLKYFTDSNNEYNYKFGVAIKLSECRNQCEIVICENGCKSKEINIKTFEDKR